MNHNDMDPSAYLHHDDDDDGNDGDMGDGMGMKEIEVREQDRFLPIANIARIMKTELPGNAKIAKDAKESIQECVSEFISFITSEASDKCLQEKRKTINGDDLLWAMSTLGFDKYIDPLKLYLSKYRESVKGEKPEKKPSAAALRKSEQGSLTSHLPMGISSNSSSSLSNSNMHSHQQQQHHHHHQTNSNSMMMGISVNNSHIHSGGMVHNNLGGMNNNSGNMGMVGPTMNMGGMMTMQNSSMSAGVNHNIVGSSINTNSNMNSTVSGMLNLSGNNNSNNNNNSTMLPSVSNLSNYNPYDTSSTGPSLLMGGSLEDSPLFLAATATGGGGGGISNISGAVGVGVGVGNKMGDAILPPLPKKRTDMIPHHPTMMMTNDMSSFSNNSNNNNNSNININNVNITGTTTSGINTLSTVGNTGGSAAVTMQLNKKARPS